MRVSIEAAALALQHWSLPLYLALTALTALTALAARAAHVPLRAPVLSRLPV